MQEPSSKKLKFLYQLGTLEFFTPCDSGAAKYIMLFWLPQEDSVDLLQSSQCCFYIHPTSTLLFVLAEDHTDCWQWARREVNWQNPSFGNQQ